MRADERGFVHPRLVVGALIMVVGALFLFDNLDIMDVDDVVRFWPLFFVAVGATMAMQPSGTANRGFGVFLVVAGLWILLYDFDILPVSFWDIWPVFLIGAGGWMIWRAVGQPVAPSRRPGDVAPGRPSGGPAASSADTVSAFAFMSGIERANNSKSFRGADLTAIMGGVDLDLRDAGMGHEPVIDAFAFWGGIEVKVPDDWVVINKVMPLMGGLEDDTRPVEGSSKELLIRGSAIMGGMKVTN